MSQINTVGRLHCPACKSRNLVATAEASKTEGFATSTRVSKNQVITNSTASTFVKNFWLCRDCGHKFRNIENLEQELRMEEKALKGSVIGIGGGALLAVVCLVLMLAKGTLGMMIGVLPFLLGLLLLVLCFVQNRSKKKAVESLKNRIAYLKVNCFQ